MKSGVVGSKSSSRRFLFARLDAPLGQSAKRTVEKKKRVANRDSCLKKMFN
jgi:hypothetical protein